jgi:nucleoside-diphosphate-sugar epimerase
MSTRSVLIIGGAGYIGPVVTERLLKAGYQVTCLDVLLYDNGRSVIPFLSDPNFRFLYGDLRDQSVLDQALEDATDVVLLAGLVGDPITKKYPQYSRLINDEGVSNCIDQFSDKGLERVVFVSTCSNYGLLQENEFADENHPLNPLSPYAASKVRAERHLLSKLGAVDYIPTILRFATAFGVAHRMRFDLTVNEFTRELALGKELLVFDAHTWRPYCHVRDFARLIHLVLEAPEASVAFEVFNAGGDINNFTKQGIVDVIVQQLPDSRVTYKEHGHDPRNYRVNFRKVRDTLGFEPHYRVTDGVTELLDAIRNHLFDDADRMRRFHGNYDIEYSCR